MSNQSEVDLSAGRLNQLLYLAADGDTDAVIAEKLDISPNTVATYWKRLRKKTGQSKRSAIIVVLLKESHQKEAEMREIAEAELVKAHAEITALYEQKRQGINKQLLEAEGRLYEAEQKAKILNQIDRSIQGSGLIIYELGGLMPVTHKFARLNPKEFGHSQTDIVNGDIKFYDIVNQDDLNLLLEIGRNTPLEPNYRYLYTYRFKTAKDMWVMDIQSPIFDDQGQLTGIPGVVINIDHLVRQGVLPAEVRCLKYPAG